MLKEKEVEDRAECSSSGKTRGVWKVLWKTRFPMLKKTFCGGLATRLSLPELICFSEKSLMTRLIQYVAERMRRLSTFYGNARQLWMFRGPIQGTFRRVASSDLTSFRWWRGSLLMVLRRKVINLRG